GPFGSVEEVVAFEPPAHMGYVAHKGMPVRRYRADVWLSPKDAGTEVHWVGSLTPLVPGTGPLVAAYARSFVRRFISGLQNFARGAPG
ncbi:MAG TPA: SRPBCC family protein, partial [Acidimicrobiales bacterium]|nr:SRPBCC family protein [Acidimicrobiales bacterium]